MRKRTAFALAGCVVVWSLTLSGCASKTQQALQDAQAAMESAKAASAPVKSPQVYNQAQKHLDQGHEYQDQMRYGQARVEYQAAADDARLAAALAQGTTVVPPQISAPAAPVPQCGGLEDCEAARARIADALSRCEAGGRVRTRVIRGPCQEAPAPAPSASAARLMGTLVVEPPEAIVKDKSDYKIKVKYVASDLDPAGAGDNDYRILLDIAGVEPEQAEAVAPMSDFQPLRGEWTLPVTVPKGVTQAVKVKIEATIRNVATGKEQKLPRLTALIPNRAACPECAPCPKPEKPMAAAEKPAGPDWLTRVLMLLVGLVVGVSAGFLSFRKGGKSGPGMKVGE
jgi:hypothetical protein